MVLTPVLAAREPKRALLALMTFFVVGNALSAVAPNFALLLVGRVVAAFAHGAFFGIGAVLATSLVAPGKKAQAISVMFGGLTLANVLGVPLGTFVGQQWGWRATFAVITVVGVVAFVGIAALVPTVTPDRSGGLLRRELGAFRHGQVWVSLVLTALIFGGMFGAFTYVEPLLTRVGGFPESAVPWLLVAFGVGLTGGNVAGGRWADRSIDRTLGVVGALLFVVMVVIAQIAQVPAALAILLVAMGFLGFATVPALQTRVMRYAAGAPNMASAANIAAFNGGNFLGVWLSGAAIDAGAGFRSPFWVGAGFIAAGLLLLGTVGVVSAARGGRRHVGREAQGGDPVDEH